MIYVQFFNMSTGYIEGTIPPRFDKPKKLIEACGTDSVLILDGRNSRHIHLHLARQECIKRGYKGYQLFKGESFTQSSSISELFTLP